MRTIKQLFISMLLTLSSFLWIGQVSVFAQGCNQPMPDAITDIKLDGSFSVTATKDGCALFVGLSQRSRIAVLRRASGKIEHVRSVEIEGAPRALLMTHSEKILIAAATTHVAFLDAERLISGQGDPVLGYIRDGRIAGVTAGVVTQDDRYLYLSNQFTSWITIIDLDTARSRGFTPAAIVGGTATGPFPSMGLELSADGQYLYVPSLELPTASGPLTCNNFGGVHPPRSREGGILVFDAALARVNPASSVTASVLTGCGTNRLALSSDGERMYVTLSLDDALLAFDMRPVQSGFPPTLIGRLPLAVPIDVKVIDGGNKVVVSNANAASNNAPAVEREALTLWALTVIDAASFSEGKAPVLGTIPLAGGRPTNIHVASDNRTLFVASPIGIHVVDMDRVTLQPTKKVTVTQ